MKICPFFFPSLTMFSLQLLCFYIFFSCIQIKEHLLLEISFLGCYFKAKIKKPLNLLMCELWKLNLPSFSLEGNFSVSCYFFTSLPFLNKFQLSRPLFYSWCLTWNNLISKLMGLPQTFPQEVVALLDVTIWTSCSTVNLKCNTISWFWKSFHWCCVMLFFTFTCWSGIFFLDIWTHIWQY